MISPVMVGLKEARDLPNASSLCGACNEVCPVKINIPHMLLKLRSQITEGTDTNRPGATFVERFFAFGYRYLMSSPTLLSWTHRVGRLAQIPVARKGKIKYLPFPPFSSWTKARDLPALPARSFHQIWEQELSKDK